MSLLIKKNKVMLPEQVSDFFNTGKILPNRVDHTESMQSMNSDALVAPNANITETEKSFEIKLAVPGLECKDFTVEVNNNVLFISATKDDEKTEETTKYLRKEFSFNSFYRSFTLPENSQPDKIEARYQNGILFISLPKKRISKVQEN